MVFSTLEICQTPVEQRVSPITSDVEWVDGRSALHISAVILYINSSLVRNLDLAVSWFLSSLYICLRITPAG